MQSEIIIDHGDHPKPPKQTALHDSHNGYKAMPDQHKKSGGKLPAMHMVVQLNVYRDVYDHFEYLLLKRIDKDEAFWQVVTEPVPSSSTLIDTLRQAASEQIGITGFKHLSHELHSYEWYAGGEQGRDIVFSAEVSPKATVTIDQSRYSDFAWLPFDQAVQHLKWDGNKQALKQLDAHLHTKRLQMPATVTTGFYGNGSQRATGPIAPATAAAAATSDPASHTPFTGNVPKRLPDVAEDGVEELKPYPDEDDERTGEWFL